MKEIIIIGSGIGGLIAGNLLAVKGHKVTIFEYQSKPGGYTSGFYKNGFYFESGGLSLEGSPLVFKIMKEIGVFDKIEFVKQKIRFLSDEYDACISTYSEYRKMCYAAYPDEKAKLDRFFSEIMGLPGKQDADISVEEFVGRYFNKGSRAHVLLTLKGFFYPDMAAGNLITTAPIFLTDSWTVKNGMQSWTNLLAENFEKHGGNLQLNSYVDRIITKDDCAVGVACKGFDYYGDYIISACDYKKTFLRLLDDKSLVDSQLLNKIAQSQISEGHFTVYLGLDMPNNELEKYMKVPYIMFFDEAPDCDIYDPDDFEFFKKTAVNLYSMSMINPKHAPEGKSSLLIQTMVPYKWMNNWGGGDKKKYEKLKEKAMKDLIDKSSRIIPDLNKYIVYKDSATPLTYERYTHNSGGAIAGWSWNPKKKFYDQPMTANIDTHVKNLYIGSAWALQTSGVPGAVSAAYQCAVKIV
ncbi:MAG: FAD-dependent oxidoreductase [Bacillota bacterium]|nr:FAD-dependent oxidoreductase [Bacillota bacterium]